jgi:choline kinase
MKAVIIAAGCGSRLKDRHDGVPKSLMKINGKRIIDDIIGKVHRSGINEIVVVTGYNSETMEAGLAGYAGTGIRIGFVRNPDWEKANGISVLKAEKMIGCGEEFILLMSDHLFQQRMLEAVIRAPVERDEALLAVDFKIDDIPDLDDGMKVQCERIDDSLHRISLFGKRLTSYNAIDCGIFKFNHGFFSVLKKSIEAGRDSLSDACNLLSKEGKMKAVDIKDSLWIDIDTPEMLAFDDRIRDILNN